MQPMSIDDMKAAIIGNSMSGRPNQARTISSTTRPMAGSSACRKPPANTKGTWSFRQDGLMCFRYGEERFAGGCVRLSRSGDQIGLTRVDGSVEPTATLIEGMAPQLK